MEEGKELAVKDESLPFKLMDALDDQLIIAELEGRMPEILTYHFTDKGQEVWGLSKAGVDEATGELARQGEVIRELELHFTDGEKEAFFQVKSGRYAIAKDGREVLLDTKFGVKRQGKLTQKGNPNVFWYEQGSIKACRNASMRLIPKTIVQAVIENAKVKGKVKEVKHGEAQVAGDNSVEGTPETPPPALPTYEEYYQRMNEIANEFELKNWWLKNRSEVRKNLPEEQHDELVKFKDHLKVKFTEGK
jgi:hypothetical protein